jgi:hypothetical protein
MSTTRNGCYAEARAPQVFLSLETPRERRALPYTLLLEVEISSDSGLLKLVFSHYEVLVKGSKLDVIYESVRDASCTAIMPGKAIDGYSAPARTTATVTEIRIKRLQPES